MTNETKFRIWKVGNDELKAFRKREQIRVDFSGFQLQDKATLNEIKALHDAVCKAADWIESESDGSAHAWKAKHDVRLSPMWRFLPNWNFGIRIKDGYFTVPPFAIMSDRDTLPMQALGRLESVLKFLIG